MNNTDHVIGYACDVTLGIYHYDVMRVYDLTSHLQLETLLLCSAFLRIYLRF